MVAIVSTFWRRCCSSACVLGDKSANRTGERRLRRQSYRETIHQKEAPAHGIYHLSSSGTGSHTIALDGCDVRTTVDDAPMYLPSLGADLFYRTVKGGWPIAAARSG